MCIIIKHYCSMHQVFIFLFATKILNFCLLVCAGIFLWWLLIHVHFVLSYLGGSSQIFDTPTKLSSPSTVFFDLWHVEFTQNQNYSNVQLIFRLEVIFRVLNLYYLMKVLICILCSITFHIFF